MLKSGDLLNFWFGEINEDGWTAAPGRREKWFQGDREFDEEIRRRFADALNTAARDVDSGSGEFAKWRENAEGTLALILLFDQFPRNIYRGDARAFAFDGKALAVCEAGLARRLDLVLAPVCRPFFYLPLEHSEDMNRQRRAVECFAAHKEAAPAAHKKSADEGLRYAESHRDIIARFGRFPHRNAVLKRTPTAAEEQWLREGGPRFGQG